MRKKILRTIGCILVFLALTVVSGCGGSGGGGGGGSSGGVVGSGS